MILVFYQLKYKILVLLLCSEFGGIETKTLKTVRTNKDEIVCKNIVIATGGIGKGE